MATNPMQDKSNRKVMKTIQDYYLELLAAWGDSPIDEEAVKEILQELVAETVKISKQLK